jgi:hypothetical protein
MREFFDRFTPPPPASARAKARARHRALIAFAQANRVHLEQSDRPDNRFQRTATWLALAAGSFVFILLATVALIPSKRPALQEIELLGQTRKLFGPALTALIEKDSRIEVITDETPAISADQPVLIEIEQGGERMRVLGFSGRSLEVRIRGKGIRLDPLVTGNGDVILVGDDFVIQNHGRTAPGGVEFTSHAMGVIL